MRKAARLPEWVDFAIFIVVLGFGTPLLWYWGAKRYQKAADNSTWRDRASLVGLTAPVISFGVWLVTVVWA